MNTKRRIMKQLTIMFSVLFFSIQLSAQSNKTTEFSQDSLSKKIMASDLKKDNLKQVKAFSTNKILTKKDSIRKPDSSIKTNNKEILEPKL